MPNIRRLVAMGRRMKISEIFKPDLLAGFGRRPWPAALPVPPVSILNPAAGRETKLAFGDHGFAGLEAPVDHEVLIDARAGDHRSQLNSLVLLHYVHKWAVLSSLDCLVGHDDRIRVRC